MKPPVTAYVGYLRGWEAIDTARMTGLALQCAHARVWDEPDVGPLAAADAVRRGVWHEDDVVLDLTRLSWHERWRVAWCRLGVHYFLDCMADNRMAAAGGSPAYR